MPKPTLLLVGPGKYFGKEIAQRFAQEGFCIAIISKTESSAQDIVNGVKESGGDAISYKCDVTNAKQCKEVIKKIEEKWGVKITSTIFNVKESPVGDGTMLSPDLLAETLRVNVGGALTILQAAMPHMAQGASFIVTGGGYKDVPHAEKCALSVSKGALHTLALALIDPCLKKGIHVKTVVIDGAVRAESALSPERVAQTYWEMHNSERFEAVIR